MNTKDSRAALKPALALALLCGVTLPAGIYAPRSRAAATQSRGGGTPAVGDPVTRDWLLYALREHRMSESEIVRQIEGRRSEFLPTAEEEKELRAAGATDRVLEAVRKSFIPPPADGGGGPGDAAGPVDYTRPFKQSEVIKKAVITSKPEPGYTEEAQANGVVGVVRLRGVLNSNGKVTDISVIKGLPDGLTEKCIAAAKRIKFRPAEKDGRKVSQYVVLEYHFSF